MLDQIERHFRERAGAWRLDVLPSARLRALLRANPEHDGIVHDIAAGHVGTVLFWFRDGDHSPFLVSKIVGEALSDKAIAECVRLQESANQLLRHHVFPRIHDVARLHNERIVFMEAVNGPNYEIQLARAICGPERSATALQRVVTRLFHELGSTLRGLQSLKLSDKEVRWGTLAAGYARHFLELCPGAGRVVSDARIAAMAELIDTLPLHTHFVLTEDHVANYLPGPSAVDQLVPEIHDLCSRWPGPVSGLRILVAFFRASPIREAFVDDLWLDALASCIVEGERVEIVGAPVRRLLDDIGLGSSPPRLIWAFVMGVFFMRASQELEFHAENVIAAKLRDEFLEYAESAIRISDALETAVGGAGRHLAFPRLHRQHLDGEFNNRDHPNFHAFPQTQAPAPLPRWVAPVVRFQMRLKERHEGVYRIIRWIYRLPLDLLDKFGRSSHK